MGAARGGGLTRSTHRGRGGLGRARAQPSMPLPHAESQRGLGRAQAALPKVTPTGWRNLAAAKRGWRALSALAAFVSVQLVGCVEDPRGDVLAALSIAHCDRHRHQLPGVEVLDRDIAPEQWVIEPFTVMACDEHQVRFAMLMGVIMAAPYRSRAATYGDCRHPHNAD